LWKLRKVTTRSADPSGPSDVALGESMACVRTWPNSAGFAAMRAAYLFAKRVGTNLRRSRSVSQ
jgi:hypothetical protein